MTPKQKRIALNIIRILVSAALLTWVLTTIDLAELLGLAQGANPTLLAAAYALGALSIVIRAYRWHGLLRAVGARPPFGRLLYLYFVGQFFSSFLPTGFAGDTVRVLEIGEGVDAGQATGTVIVDRLSGFISLFLLALFALPFARGLVPAELTWLLAGLSAAIIGGSLLLFEGRLLRRLTGWLPGPLSLSGTGFLARTYTAIVTCGGRAVAIALLVSTLFNLELMLAIYTLAVALHISVSYWHILLFTPLTVTALLFPFAISGLGVRESIYIALYTQPGVGVSPASATALGLGAFSMDLFNGLIGGVLYLLAGALGLRIKA